MKEISGKSGRSILEDMNPLLQAIFCLLVSTTPSHDAAGADLEEQPEATPWWTFVETKPLFPPEKGPDGMPMGWWVSGGPANYVFEKGPEDVEILHGSGDSPRNAFLVDPVVTGDFRLDFEVLIERGGGNSGVQIRSRADEDRMVGYQIEIDPSPRSWSGGLYDEGRRGWIASLADDIGARDAFVPGKWNRFVILAVGPRIRTWINDVPAVDHIDFADRSGRIGLQVHGGRCEVRWRNLVLADLGLRERRVFGPDQATLGVEVMPANGLTRSVTTSEPGFDFSGNGVDLEVNEIIPDAPSILEITATVRRGSLRISLGNTDRGPGYLFTIPAPLGGADRPGAIRIIRDVDGTTVFVDDDPLVPGPVGLAGPLEVSIEAGRGIEATLHRIEMEPPTVAESEAIERWRSAAKSGMIDD